MDYLKGPGPLEGHRQPDYRDEFHHPDPDKHIPRIASGILGRAGQRSIPPSSLQGRVSAQPPPRLTGLTKSGGLGAIRREEADALSRLINDIETPPSRTSQSPDFRRSADDALFHLIQELEEAASPPNPASSKREEVKVKENPEMIENPNPEKTKKVDDPIRDTRGPKQTNI